MASWKKVALETTAVSFSDLTLTNLSTQGSEVKALMINSSNVVGTRDLGANAFTNTTIGTTTSALTDGAGITDFTFNGSGAAVISVDIANATNLGSSVASGDLLLVADIDDSNNVKRTSVADIVGAVSTGVTTVKLTGDSGDTGADNGSVDHTIAGGNGIITSVSGDTLTVTLDITDANLGTLSSVDQADMIAVADESATDDVTKAITFSNFEDTIFGNISGDATVAAGGALTIANGAVENTMLANNSVTIGTTAINLGASSTTLAGMTGIDFASGNASIAASIGSNTLTIGHANSHVKIAGDLQVVGTTETVDTTELLVEDKTVTLANGGHSAANGDHAGIIIDTSSTDANRAEFVWKNTGIGVAGWQFKDDGASASFPDMGVAALTLGTADPTSAIMPVGSLFYNDGTSENEGLYLYTTT